MTPRRYQLRKDAVSIIERGHPWIFREQMSSAADVFADGQWLRLVDGTNRVVGHGMYEAEGAIAIRVVRLGRERPDAAYVRGKLEAAIARRAPLIERTDAIRLVHGESDGLPAVVADRFGDTIVVASYAAGADALARYVARVIAAEASAVARATTDVSDLDEPPTLARDPEAPPSAPSELEPRPAPPEPPTNLDPAVARRFVIGPARHVLVRPARRRHGDPPAARTIRGTAPELVLFTEDSLALAVDLAAGHKTGTYLDLRGLRRAVATAPLAGARVLNLFAYTGMLGRAAEAAGAAAIVSVDASARALAFAATHHIVDPARHRFLTADVFDWLPALDLGEQFDLVIVDPPAMTSRKAQVPQVLAAYRKLYRAAARHVRPGGAIVAACCTSRIERDVFARTVRAALGERFTLERELPPELDHPVGFPQADYLKIGWWRAAPGS
jgi:23S rRNA (cytosine1962-C5)-methyltransferase